MNTDTYIRSVLTSSLPYIESDTISIAEFSKLVCSRCPKMCKNNSFCRYIFTILVVKRRDVNSFMRVLSAYLDNYTNVPSELSKFRAYVCDRCIGCLSYSSKMSNVHCTLAWYDQTDNNNESYILNQPKLPDIKKIGPKSMCSNGTVRMFVNESETRNNTV